MYIRLYNARILSMKDDSIIDGEIWIKDDKIIFAGTKEETNEAYLNLGINDISFEEVIDCERNLLMPGFKNAHTHSGMTFLRSFAEDVPLQTWLNEKVFPMEAKLDSDMIYHLTKLANLEYLTSGITSIFDMYLTPESIAKSCVDMGMRIVQCCNINNFSLSLQELEEMYLKLNDFGPLSSYKVGFHAEYTCSKELLEGVSEIAHKYKAPVYAHISETALEVKECKSRYGLTPPKFMESLGLFDYGGGGYHCIHMEEDDYDVFKNHNLSVVTNPASNAKIASGICPVSEYLKRGINVAIGTDGPASNNCLDMFREMFLVAGLARLKENDAAAVDAFDVLKMATVNGAKAMELDDCDILDVGKQADIIMIDLNTPNMQPINNIAKNIVYSGSKSNIKMTMIAGDILYYDGKFKDTYDVQEIYAKANSIIDKLR